MEPPADVTPHPGSGYAGGVRRFQRLTPARAAVIVVLFAVAVLFSRSCQQAQVRLTKDQAIATAKREVDFTPKRVAVRMVRQGITSKPFWAVSLSVPAGTRSQGTLGADRFSKLTVVKINANSGKVEEIFRQRRVPKGSSSGGSSTDAGGG